MKYKDGQAIGILGRIDNNGHYSCGHCEECVANGWPKNVRWESQEQQINNRRNTLLINTDKGPVPLADLARQMGIPYKTAYSRLRAGTLALAVATVFIDLQAGGRIQSED